MSPPSLPPPHDPDEYVAQDDRIIGRVFRGSALVIAGLAVAGALAYWATHRAKPQAIRVTPLSAPKTAAPPRESVPNVGFTDITQSSGLQFTHVTGAYGEKLLPETMGSGAAFLDFDRDGDQDLLLVNSSHWPWQAPPGAGSPPAGVGLFRNDSASGAIRFTDVTAGSGLEAPFYGMGVGLGDVDGDGRTDVLITGVGGARLFRNEEGGFRDITAASGVAGDPKDWSTAAAFFDFDNDGDLDLYVANYVRWSREIDAEVGYKLDGVHRAYGPPMNFAGTLPHFYRNEGAGKFTDITAQAGLQVTNTSTGVPVAKSLGLAPIDLDGDGFMDLVVANDTVQNFVFMNRRNGTFQEAGALTGIAFDGNGTARGAMGVDAARFTEDGKVAVAIGNFANEMTAFYVAQTEATLFADEAISWGIGPASRLLLKFGIFFFDYDLDGRLDVLSANGHLEEDISRIQASQHYRQPAQLFWNAGAQGFVNVGSESAGEALFSPIVGRGSAFADIDGDGDLDVVLTQTGGTPRLLRNDQQLGHHWLRFVLRGTHSNREGIGAWVRVKAGGHTLARQVMPTRSYLSQSELPVTIGLGKSTTWDDVEIEWPGGARQKVKTVRLDAVTTVDQSAPSP
jgi:hypothetical protein